MTSPTAEAINVPRNLEELPDHALKTDLRVIHGEANVATEADHKGTLNTRPHGFELCGACKVIRDDPPPRQDGDPDKVYCIECDVEWSYAGGRWQLPE